ncbi:helix-turn-helix domain-containing protein [Magnetovibrio sp. PR-2]|uniref:helix-turn-helix domain-containing protein n=1 Tax=Magnetovibrio sp. PR-2 TaxID=3120356 RepID=UPI003FA5242B
MGKNYDQLDIDERYEIYRLHQSNMSLRKIGRLMGRDASTISRELERNTLPCGEYKPASADRIAMSRRCRLSRIELLSFKKFCFGSGEWLPQMRCPHV